MAISTIDSSRPSAKNDSSRLSSYTRRKGDAFLLALIGLNIIIFISGLLWPGLRWALMLHTPAEPSSPLATAFLNWRAMASYTFVHAGPAHLFFNMVILWIVGSFILRRRGLRHIIISYLLGAIGGGLGFLTTSSFFVADASASLCGASSAILGMCGAALCYAPKRHMTLLIWCAIGISLLGNLSAVGLVTHLAGLAAGWLYAERNLIIK